MVKSQFKKPSSQNQSKNIKTPEGNPQVSFDEYHPIFSFEYLDSEYCISRCERDDKASFADKLRILGSMTWGTIKQSGRHQAGYERIPRRIINGHIPPQIITEDVVDFIAFRFSGLKSMVGHRKDQLFYVIWLDRNFTLYDHG